ncbi:hypothetical protein [Streptomyces sp. NPDC090445]|uniref:hypothetical protein n=1 Tax=Streptomyces sp. NPDC090445 TaxID=3365963 RepID=UPI00381DE243
MTMQPFASGLIAVVSGGRSTERERSLMSGRAALESLDRQGYTTLFLDPVDKDFTDGVRRAHVAFLAHAGQYAGDGKLQGLLECLNIPYTGSGVAAAAIGMHKALAKTIAAAASVAVLPTVTLPPRDGDVITKAITGTITFPLILKPLSEGGSIGMSVCHDTAQLAAALLTLDPALPSWRPRPRPITRPRLRTRGDVAVVRGADVAGGRRREGSAPTEPPPRPAELVQPLEDPGGPWRDARKGQHAPSEWNTPTRRPAPRPAPRRVARSRS